jgi:hypothetical protein
LISSWLFCFIFSIYDFSFSLQFSKSLTLHFASRFSSTNCLRESKSRPPW